MEVIVDTNFIKILNALEETGNVFDRDNIIRLSYLTGPKKFEEILLKFKGNKGDLITILNSVSEKNKKIVTNLIEKQSKIDQKRMIDDTISSADFESDQYQRSNLDGLEFESSTICFGSPNCRSLHLLNADISF